MKVNLKHILLVIVSIGNMIVLSACDSNPLDNQVFNQQLWLKNTVTSGNSNNIRLEMSEDLVNNHLKAGMTQQQTRQLLGKPDTEQKGYDEYYLGEYWLKLTFDNQNKLIKKEIYMV